MPLRDILNNIEQQHNIRFSLIEEEVSVYTLLPPATSLKLEGKLDYIEQQTRLKFKAITKKLYTVANDVRMDKPLCGYLVDAESGQPVENAQISVAGIGVVASSDTSGYFKLPVLSSNFIEIKLLGYTTKTLSPATLYVPDCPAITLEPVTLQLEEAVTERYLASGIIKKETGELVVKPARFGILPGLTEPDVLLTMQQLPGVTSIDETVSNINVRGGTHDQNLFLWNGVRMYQTGHFFGLISAFNPLPATSISIFRNGTPAFYGESVSSLVDISTHTSVPDSTVTAVTADMISLNFLTRIRFSEKASIQVAGRRTYSDIFATPTFKDYQERVFQNTTVTDVRDNLEVPVLSAEDFRFYDFSVQYQHLLSDKHTFIIDAIGVENSLDVSQSTTAASRTSNLSQKNFGGSINLSSQWNTTHRTELQAYVSYYNLDAANEAIENEQLTKQQNTVLDEGLRAKYIFTGIKNLRISAGYQFNETGIRNADEVNIPSFSRNVKEVSRSHSLIAEGKYVSPDGKTNISAGMRANYFEKYKLLLPEPRLSASRRLSNTLLLQANAEQKSQTILQIVDLQQDFLGIEKRRWVLANEADIPIQRSNQVSLGMNYNFNGWLVSAEGFYKKVTGITSDSQAFQNQFEFAPATGEYNVAGAELLLQKSFRRFNSWVSYSYNDNNYYFDGYVPPGFANNFAISHAVNAAGIYEWNNLRIALGTRYRTGKPVTEPFGFTIDPDNPLNSAIIYRAPNSTNLPANIQVNFSASKTWIFKKYNFTASCSVLNALDRKNVINRFYRINKSNNSVESISTYGLGRTPNISLKILF